MSERRRGFMFRVDRGRGWTQICVFYAATVSEATKYAREWAEPRGYTVELVPDTEAVS